MKLIFLFLSLIMTTSILIACNSSSDSSGATDLSSDISSVSTWATTTKRAPITLVPPNIEYSEAVNLPASVAYASSYTNRVNTQGWINLNEYLFCTDPTHFALLDGNVSTIVNCSLDSLDQTYGTVTEAFSVAANTELNIYAIAIRYTDHQIPDDVMYGVQFRRVYLSLKAIDVNGTFEKTANHLLLMPSNTVYIELHQDAAALKISTYTPLSVSVDLLPTVGIADIVFYGDVVIYP